ncbi:MAG: response regulator [Desulfobacterales bacterium]|nr:response regulator [Desulfobacterales bacterium]
MSDIAVKKILVVDDEEELLTLLSDILKRANYEVISTTRGKEAIELAINRRPDVVILDIGLPDMDGTEVAAVFGGNPSTADIPIIFLTGIITKQEEESVGRKTGKHYIIAKPVRVKVLLEMVSKVLSS